MEKITTIISITDQAILKDLAIMIKITSIKVKINILEVRIRTYGCSRITWSPGTMKIVNIMILRQIAILANSELKAVNMNMDHQNIKRIGWKQIIR